MGSISRNETKANEQAEAPPELVDFLEEYNQKSDREPTALDATIVELDCYEPNSQSIRLTGRDLCQHLLITGTTGSGKTTGLLYPMLRDLIAYRASDPRQKMGLLVYDCKSDALEAFVRQQAAAVGRSKDVVVLGTGHYHLDYFSENLSIDDIKDIVEQWSSFIHDEHTFFDQNRKNMLEAGITLYLILRKKPNFSGMLEFLSELINEERAVMEVIDMGQSIKNACKELRKPQLQSKIHNYIQILKAWRVMDQRTKSNCIGCINNVLTPMHSTLMNGLFQNRQKSRRFHMREISEKGKIVILKLPAIAMPTETKFVGNMVKALLLSEILQRSEQTLNPDQRMMGLVMDEYPLVATGNHPRFGDPRQLQTVRSKGVFYLAAVQSFSGLEAEVGSNAMDALLANFGNYFFMRSTEPRLEQYAAIQLGVKMQEITRSPPAPPAPSDLDFAPPPRPRKFRVPRAIIEPGSLSRLESHECYIALSNGYLSKNPHAVVPLFPNLQQSATVEHFTTNKPELPASIKNQMEKIEKRIEKERQREQRSKPSSAQHATHGHEDSQNFEPYDDMEKWTNDKIDDDVPF